MISKTGILQSIITAKNEKYVAKTAVIWDNFPIWDLDFPLILASYAAQIHNK